MKDVILLYKDCCIYEIVNTCYYLKYSGADVIFAALDTKPVKTMEGFSINADCLLNEIDLSGVRSLIIPGGDVKNIRNCAVKDFIRKEFSEGKLVAAICAAVDIADEAGILEGIASTHSTEKDCVTDCNVITARANAYIDFGIEIAKYLGLFSDENDLNETVDFWKYFKRMQ